MAARQHIEIEVAPHPRTGLHGVAVVLAGVVALIFDASATPMINVGLPFLEGRVAATPEEGAWLITVFNATYYATILASPWLCVRFGRKPLLLVALIGFAMTSLLLSSITSFPEMVALRAVQGAFQGAIFVPAALLMFLSLQPKMLAIAIPGFALFSLFGSSVGSLVGGYFAETYGAGEVFLPGAIATLAIAVLVAVSAPNVDRPQRHAFDAVGVMFSLLMFGSMQYLTNEGELRNWLDDSHVVIAAVVLAFAAAAFILWELYGARHPHVNLDLFARFRNLTIGGLVNVVVGFLGYSVTAFVAYLQQTLDTSATTAGEMILLRVPTYLIGVPLAFIVIRKRWVDVRIVVGVAAFGTTLSLIGFWRLITPTSAIESFVLITLIYGIFFGALNQPTPALVIGGLPARFLLGGLAIYKVSSPIGTMLGTATSQTFLDHRIALHGTQIAGTITLANGAVASFLAQGGTLHTLAVVATSQARVMSYADLMLVLAAVALVVVPVVALVQTKPPPAPDRTSET